MDIAFHGHPLRLLPEGAAQCRASGRLFVADLHLGKGAAFRAQGQPLPAGGSAHTLQRLSALIERTAAPELVVLGDFWHARSGLTPALLEQVACWLREQAPPTRLVLGNHDRPIHPSALPLQALHGPLALPGGLHAAHEPPLPLPGEPPRGRRRLQAEPAGLPPTLAGHLHPAVPLQGRAGERLRLPAFVQHGPVLVLPAFGTHTGCLSLPLPALQAAGAGAWVSDGQRVLALLPPR